MNDIAASAQWSALCAHADDMRGRVHLRDLFADDPSRCERYVVEMGDLVLDFSRHLVTDHTLELLSSLAAQAGVAERVSAMLGGETVNTTEQRPALHTALRALPDASAIPAPLADTREADAQDVDLGRGHAVDWESQEPSESGSDASALLGVAGASPDRARRAALAAAVERERMAVFVEAVHSGERRGASGKAFRTVVSLGIGGSHLGPAMAAEALDAFADGRIACRFASNVDPSELTTALRGLDPAETLFVVISKSFTTSETLANARSAKAWIKASLGKDATGLHFVAVTADSEAAARFGIAPENVFRMWDWVGGRFSVASAAGLALMLAIGEENFAEMLCGMRIVDNHLAAYPRTGASVHSRACSLESGKDQQAVAQRAIEPVFRERQSRGLVLRDLRACAPVLMGLLAVWNRSFMGFPARAILPYASRLRLFPVYLQQLLMESNGKRVRLDGAEVACDTGEVVWGGLGTDSQHSFHQLLHQGTTVVPADFIVFANPDDAAKALPGAAQSHETLVANCFAQAETLAFGATPAVDDPLGAHRELPGNRPSTVIMASRLTPSVLGQLVALYEHQTAVQGALWGINSFDQFGVEHGKSLATQFESTLNSANKPPTPHQGSKASLIANYHRLQTSKP